MYYCYRPFFVDLTSKRKYVLQRTLKVANDCQDLLPQTLAQFETWCQKLDQCMYDPNDEIDFYALSTNYGENVFQLLELKTDGFRKKERAYQKKLLELEKEECFLLKQNMMNLDSSMSTKQLKKIREQKQKCYQNYQLFLDERGKSNARITRG